MSDDSFKPEMPVFKTVRPIRGTEKQEVHVNYVCQTISEIRHLLDVYKNGNERGTSVEKCYEAGFMAKELATEYSTKMKHSILTVVDSFLKKHEQKFHYRALLDDISSGEVSQHQKLAERIAEEFGYSFDELYDAIRDGAIKQLTQMIDTYRKMPDTPWTERDIHDYVAKYKNYLQDNVELMLKELAIPFPEDKLYELQRQIEEKELELKGMHERAEKLKLLVESTKTKG